jgi:hypothetical protein
MPDKGKGSKPAKKGADKKGAKGAPAAPAGTKKK